MKRKQKLTMNQLVEAAHALGAEVTVSLVPKNLDQAVGWQSTPAGDRLQEKLAAQPSFTMNDKNWPGDPTCRSILASAASDAEVAKEFKHNPSSQWVITADRILERDSFFKQLQAVKEKAVLTTAAGTEALNP